MGNDTNYTSLIALVGTLALLIATVYLVMNSTSFSQVRSELRSSYVPTGMLDYGEKGKILKTLGFAYGIRNDFSRYKHSPPDSERSGLFRRKREVGGQVYVANPGSIYKLPSSLAVSNRQNSGALQLVSVVLDERALLDPEVGIVNSPLLRGRDGERPATVSFYTGGELHAAVNVAIKADGDRSVRRGMAGRLDQDYRILMREKYGSESVSAEEIFRYGDSQINWPDHFRREIQHGFDIDGIFELRAGANDQRQFLVDGYSVSAPYTGKYFNNQTVELAVQPANSSSPVIWDVGGEKITGNPIRIEVTSDIEVRLVSAATP